MKKTFVTFSLLLVTLFTYAGVYTVNIENAPANAKSVMLKWLGVEKISMMKVIDGKASIDTTGFTPQYVQISCGRPLQTTIWLEPDKDLTINIAPNGKVECTGALADINTYLITTRRGNLGYRTAGRSEQEFITVCDSLYKAEKAKLDAARLPESFAKVEDVRLRYTTQAIYPLYKQYHENVAKVNGFTPSQVYYAKLNDLAVENPEWLTIPGYLDFISSTVKAHIYRQTEGTYNERFENYVRHNIKNAAIRGAVVHNFVYELVSNQGLDGNESLVALYKECVTNAGDKEIFDIICQKWEKLRAGSPSPTFNCPDINGKMVSLESLRGKYVYIDIWATWCGPCRGELPHLEKLEETYAGKDICFVSLSCDQNKKAWEKMVREKNMKGIQLHGGANMKFMDDYLINGIPRFILLDREGKIVRADAPRPSSPETSKLFDELLVR